MAYYLSKFFLKKKKLEMYKTTLKKICICWKILYYLFCFQTSLYIQCRLWLRWKKKTDNKKRLWASFFLDFSPIWITKIFEYVWVQFHLYKVLFTNFFLSCVLLIYRNYIYVACNNFFFLFLFGRIYSCLLWKHKFLGRAISHLTMFFI